MGSPLIPPRFQRHLPGFGQRIFIFFIEVLHPQKLKICIMDIELTAINFSVSFFRAPEASYY